MDALEKKLACALQDSVHHCMPVDVHEPVAIAFSGGLDSSIIAFIASSMEERMNVVHLYTVGVEGCRDFDNASNSAQLLGIPRESLEFIVMPSDSGTVKALAAEARGIIGKPEGYFGMELDLSLPLLLLCDVLKKQGIRTLLSGQGADELFAGYARYGRITDSEALSAELACDWEKLEREGLPRDEAVCNSRGITLRTPFTSDNVAGIVRSIPHSVLLESASGRRKNILRRVAGLMGIPQEIANAGKKAFQYGSGSHLLLLKIKKL